MSDQNVKSLTKKQYAIQFVKFTLFSISAGVIQFSTSTALHEVKPLLPTRISPLLPDWLVYLIPLILSVLYNFTINRHFTFKSANNIPLAMMKVAGYYFVFTPLSTWWVNYFRTINWNFYLVLIGTMAVNFVTEFLFDFLVVFRKTINTNRLGQREREKAQLQIKTDFSSAD